MKQPVAGASDFHSRFGIELTEAYGIIEVGLPCINRSGVPSKRGSVGRVLPDYELKIIDRDSEGVGEICVRGRGLFDAYFSPWQSRDEVLSDGWFRTGDVGSLDKEGFLYVVGRKKNLINFAGMKIFPYEVESVLKEHPGIKEALVYGIEHRRYGEIPCAKIVLDDVSIGDPDSIEIRRFCYQRLAPYKVPKKILRVGALEKTPGGKLRRR
jgi:long-chain acyl-CoA synthetase